MVAGTEELNKKLAKNKAVHDYMDEDGNMIQIITDFKIRNYKTMLKKEDKEIYCKCGEKLSTKDVKFWPNSMGKTVWLPVQFCPKCDDTPPDSSQMWVTINDNFVILPI